MGASGRIASSRWVRFCTDAELARKARDKNHDISTGNQPDGRLRHFIAVNMMTVAEEARAKFEAYKDLLEGFVAGDMGYSEFTARVRRRRTGQTDEDYDWEEE